MNCHDFINCLYEYLDETLTPDLQAAAAEHLRHCADCRRAVEREQALAASLHQAMGQAALPLSYRAPAVSNDWCRPANSLLFRLWDWLATPAGIVTAAAAASSLLLVAVYAVHRTARHVANAPAAFATVCVVDVPLEPSAHFFRQENDTVVDAVESNPALAHARFP